MLIGKEETTDIADIVEGDKTTAKHEVNGSRVQVFLLRLPSGVQFIRCRLESKLKIMTGVRWTQADFEITSDVEKKVSTACGYLAERQNEMSFDKHNPSDCARAGREAFRELMLKLRKRGIA